MKFGLRLIAVAVVVGACLLAHLLLVQYLKAPGELQTVMPARPLAELPMEIGGWVGEDVEVTDENQKFGEDYIQRAYRLGNIQGALVWIVYAADGEDRGHHPEICMAVAGRPENTSARTTLDVPGFPQPVQQYQFGTQQDSQWVFYWHYTLNPPPNEELDELQRTFQRMRKRPSSMTLEVFAPAGADVETLQQFVIDLDAAVQEILPPHAERGSRRSPVIRVDDGTTATETEAAARPGSAGAPTSS
ncbi:MAG: exosortase-associated EpsI family protein [Pirellulales bacterium]|nr:exosortase-associated EpsI family protein [Pirellulales bacterium]